MSEPDDIPPMDEQLRGRLRSVADAFDGEANAHAQRSLERLAAALPGFSGGGGGGGGHGAAKAVGRAAMQKLVGPVVASLVVGAAVGGAVTHALEPVRERVVYVERAAPVMSVTPAMTTSTPAIGIRVDDLPSVAAPIATASAVPSSSVSTSARISAERLLLDDARSAFASGDYERALGVLRQHDQRFHDGVLAEERDAMMIRTLAALGRKSEVDTRGRAFVAKYPDSIMRPVVESAMGSP
jgi:hypothetical protein